MSDNTISVTVSKKVLETNDIASYELVPTGGGMLPEFSAGSHVDVHIKDQLMRQYSICNSPSERHRYVIGILNCPDSRGGSRAMHEEIKEGDILTISTPRNLFHLLEDAPYSILMGGGIGVTPILSMAHRLHELGKNFTFYYCARSADCMAFRDYIKSLPFADRVHFHFDDENPLDIARLLSKRPDGANLYVCGPEGFMSYCIASTHDSWPASSVHREYFSVDPAAGHDEERSFSVKIDSTGVTFEIPEDKTIAEVLNSNGFNIPISCEQGICGTCMVRVADGVPDHRDTFQTDAEKDANTLMTVCCSRALSDEITLLL